MGRYYSVVVKIFITVNVQKGNKLVLFRYNVTKGLLG